VVLCSKLTDPFRCEKQPIICWELASCRYAGGQCVPKSRASSAVKTSRRAILGLKSCDLRAARYAWCFNAAAKELKRGFRPIVWPSKTHLLRIYRVLSSRHKAPCTSLPIHGVISFRDKRERKRGVIETRTGYSQRRHMALTYPPSPRVLSEFENPMLDLQRLNALCAQRLKTSINGPRPPG